NDERLAALDVDADFLSRLHPVEEDRRRQDADTAVLEPLLHVIEEYLGVHQVRGELIVSNLAPSLRLDLLPNLREIRWRQHLSGSHRERLGSLQHLLLQ